MLLYCNSCFIQLLEGEEAELNKLFDLISLDPRHNEVAKIIDGCIEKPRFPDWSMGYKFLSRKQLTSLEKHEDPDVYTFIRKTQPFKLLKLMSVKSWN